MQLVVPKRRLIQLFHQRCACPIKEQRFTWLEPFQSIVVSIPFRPAWERKVTFGCNQPSEDLAEVTVPFPLPGKITRKIRHRPLVQHRVCNGVKRAGRCKRRTLRDVREERFSLSSRR